MTPTRKELMDQLRNLLPAVLPPYQLAVIGEALAETCKLADGAEVKQPATKLYVVGETSPNPEEWSDWVDVSLVLAGSADEAAQLVLENPQLKTDVCEIPMTKPGVLLTRYGAESRLDD